MKETMKENQKITITVSGNPNDMRGWFAEKSGRILEELSFLADTLHRPGEAPAGGWPTKREEADFHLSQAVKCALAIAALSDGTGRQYKAEDITRIVDGGHKEYLRLREEGRTEKRPCSQNVRK